MLTSSNSTNLIILLNSLQSNLCKGYNFVNTTN